MASAAHPQGHPLVLIADNEPGVLDAVQLLLELEGYAVIAASDGAEALARLAEGDFDLLITDLNLPVVSGEELVRRLRAEPRFASLPVILTSIALPPGADIIGAVDGFLCKPFALSRLAQLMDLLLSDDRDD